jgi:hypothetical protein
MGDGLGLGGVYKIVYLCFSCPNFMQLKVSGHMKKHFTIFYSWQSDIKKNRNSIESCLKKAINAVRRTYGPNDEIIIHLDKDTANRSGSPSIVDTIFTKISMCDIFVCEVTVINTHCIGKALNYRVTPNPNVLIELGFAASVLGWERVICINDTNFSKVEDLPFDIRDKRITSFQSSNADFKAVLTSHLNAAIQSIINDFDKIIERQRAASTKQHDINIYEQSKRICDENRLHNSIDHCVNNLVTNCFYYEIWDKLEAFHIRTDNAFLDDELNQQVRLFLNELSSFESIVTTNFHHQESNNPKYLSYESKEESGEPLTAEEKFEYLQMQKLRPHKSPFSNENFDDANRRIQELQYQLREQGVKTKGEYRNFVLKVKASTI